MSNGDAPVDSLVAGRYYLKSRWGRGANARVYLGWDSLLDRLVAIKVPRAHTERANRTLKREGRLVSGLSHPGVIAMLDHGQLPDGRLYLVFEFVAGTSLDAVVRTGSINVSSVVDFGICLATTLEYVHSCAIVHRDVKPGNVLIPGSGSALQWQRAKLIDFATARRIDDVLADGRPVATPTCIAGTPAYAAPEQLLGRPLSIAADLYALGATLFELLYGVPPFSAESFGVATLEPDAVAHERGYSEASSLAPLPLMLVGPLIVAKLSKEVVPPEGDIPDDLRDLVRLLLRIEPKERPTSARAVIEALRRIAAKLGSTTSGQPPTHVAREPVSLDEIETRDE